MTEILPLRTTPQDRLLFLALGTGHEALGRPNRKACLDQLRAPTCRKVAAPGQTGGRLDAIGEVDEQSAPSPDRAKSAETFTVLKNGIPTRSGNRGGKPRLFSALVLGLVLVCGGCAGTPRGPATADDAASEHDPAEPVNRAIFKANVAADHAVMKPVAQAYADHVPEAVQKGVRNVVQNLKEPSVAVNDALQGNMDHAWQSVQRLAVNSTVGVAGIFDVADKWGVPPHKADFGQTMAVWGVGEGPFVELPLLGPSNARDAVGTAVDMAMNPLTFVGGAPATYAGVATGGANVVDTRAQHLHDLDELERNSLDYYATLRSVYRQHRDGEIATAKERERPPEGQVDISFPNSRP